jgi:hypothetical protein
LKLLLIFLYSTAITVMWWLLFNVSVWWAWGFFVPAFAVGLALVYWVAWANEKQRIGEFLRSLAKDSRPWPWRS